MPNIFFASNSVSHFPGAEISNQGWTYDANRVPYSLETPPATIISTPQHPISSTDESWYHFRCGAVDWLNVDEPIASIVDVNGETILDFRLKNYYTEGYKAILNSTSQQAVEEKYIPVADMVMRTFDIQLVHTLTELTARIWINETLLLTASLSVTSKVVPRAIYLGGHNGGNEGAFYSEIIVSDSDTRNARLDLLRPNAAGAYEEWNGFLTSLSDDDTTTGMTTVDANRRQLTTLTSYSGANNISNVVQITTTVRGINSPSTLSHMIRMSTVDYESSDYSVGYAKEYQITDWKLNPATSLPWEATDLLAAEFGFYAKP
jgi:hypothetical protein